MGKHPRGIKPSEPMLERGLAPRLRQEKLDLLPILHELLRTRSVTRTARAFGMTQPAVSQALQRLRAAFEDPLLVPVGRDARLTHRAEALVAPLYRALNEIDLLFRPPVPFDPATEPLEIVITTADYASFVLAPVLAQLCAAEAPQVVVEFVDIPFRGVEDLDRVDFFLTPRAFGATLGKQLVAMPLWDDDIVCIAALDHDLPSSINAEAFRRMRQAAYQSHPRVPAKVRALLQPTSVLETARACTVPDFLVLVAIVEQSDCVALVPRKLAQAFARLRAIRIVELDYPDKAFAIDAYWSLAADSKRGHAWARDLLARAAKRLG